MAAKTKKSARPKLAVWKFASCDGCQLTILDAEEELLLLADRMEIADFKEATPHESQGPYDLSLVEGSITTPHDAERIHGIRRASKFLVPFGACATAGGIQALRNFADVNQYAKIVYPRPEYLEVLPRSTPISHHVPVDAELQGCPPNKYQLLEVVSAFLNGRRPAPQRHSVCTECKRRGIVCIMVARGIPCMGPVTQVGCGIGEGYRGALCPAVDRGCYGCFGPKETPNTHSWSDWCEEHGMARRDVMRAYRSFNAFAEPFRKESEARER